MSEGREGVSSVQETEESSGILETDVEEVTTETEESDEGEYIKGESATETAARLLEEENNLQGNEAQGDEAAQTDTDKPVKGQKKKESDDDYDPELIAPERLSAAEKKMFQNLPKGLKRAYHRSIKNVESQGTRTQQQASQIVQKWGDFEKNILPFAEGWAERGISVPAGLLQLATKQKQLTDPDTEKREQAYLQLARSSKVDIVKLANKIAGRDPNAGASGSIPDISQHPLVAELKSEILSLREQVNPVLSYHEQQRESYDNQVASQIVQEIETVRNERDASSGQSRYPRLFESQFLESAKPLVLALRRADPNLSWGDAYRRTYAAMTGQVHLGSSPHNASRLPATNVNNNSRATSAAVTVRGRTVPSVGSSDIEPPPEILRKGAQATMEWVTSNVGRGG